MKSKIAVIIGALIMAFALANVVTTPAQAGTGSQWCNDQGYCVNAWNGGSGGIKSYAYSTANNDFTVIGDYWLCNGGYTTSTCPGHGFPAGLPLVAFEFTGPGGYNGACVGDAHNSPNYANAAMVPCPNGNTGGWGSNFVEVYQDQGCDSGQAAFFNTHWLSQGTNGGFQVPAGNGIQIYLNNYYASCLHALPPA